MKTRRGLLKSMLSGLGVGLCILLGLKTSMIIASESKKSADKIKSQELKIGGLEIVSLVCCACGKSLSFVIYKDGRKTLGCMNCCLTPLATSPDMNKVFDAWMEIKTMRFGDKQYFNYLKRNKKNGFNIS